MIVSYYLLFSMDKFTKNYIDDIVKPMANRIQYLQRNNQQLKIHIKYLESLILNDIKSYQKPTVSATNHMRQSRISSKDNNSPDKRPSWNSKTKVEQPAYNRLSLSLELNQQDYYQKDKQKPFILKNIKSLRQYQEEEVNILSRKERKSERISETNNNYRKSSKQDNFFLPFNHEKNGKIKQKEQQQNQFQQNNGQIRQHFGEIGLLTYKFQQLVRNNTNILASMKKENQNARQTLKEKDNSLNNYVRKVRAAKSEQNEQSQTASPIDRSFVSQPLKDQENMNEKEEKQ